MPALRPTVRMIYQVGRIIVQSCALFLDLDDISKGRLTEMMTKPHNRKDKGTNVPQMYAVRRGVPINRPHKPINRR